jgi:epoxyqueuosine reductase QueG
MQKDDILKTILDYIERASGNYVAKEVAISPALAGMKMYAGAVVGFANSDSSLFNDLKKPGVIGSHFILPKEWCGNAKTVISFFLPFTEQVKKSNTADRDLPSNEWLHARIEGQAFVFDLCKHLKTFLEAYGFECVIPSMDSRFSLSSPVTKDKTVQEYYTSNWSERHVAWVCGVGTFGLSRGLITEKGIAGRIGSVVTSAYFEPLPRKYSGVSDYCTRCLACVRKCPVHAISEKEGKRHAPCSAFLDKMMEKYKPRYGCGKCQTGVPCESGIPKQG